MAEHQNEPVSGFRGPEPRLSLAQAATRHASPTNGAFRIISLPAEVERLLWTTRDA